MCEPWQTHREQERNGLFSFPTLSIMNEIQSSWGNKGYLKTENILYTVIYYNVQQMNVLLRRWCLTGLWLAVEHGSWGTSRTCCNARGGFEYSCVKRCAEPVASDSNKFIILDAIFSTCLKHIWIVLRGSWTCLRSSRAQEFALTRVK